MKSRNFKKVFAGGLFAAVVILASNATAQAATKTWDGGGSDDNLTTAANWAGDVAPIAGDDLIFPDGPSTVMLNNDFLAGTTFNSLTVNGTESGIDTTSYVLDGNAMTIGSGGIQSLVTGSGGALSINIPLTLGSSQTFVTAATSSLGISGSLNVGAYDLQISNGATSIEGSVSGSGNITVNGAAGKLYLLGDNTTYSGTITVNSGFLAVEQGNSFGAASGGTVIGVGASLNIFGDQTEAINENITFLGSGEFVVGQFPIDTSPPGYEEGEIYGAYQSDQEIVFAGNMVLGGNVALNLLAKKMTLTGPFGNAPYRFDLSTGGYGQLIIGSSSNNSGMFNGTYTPSLQTITINDEDPLTDINVYGNTTVVLNGKRNKVVLHGNNAALVGTGTVGDVVVKSGSKLGAGIKVGCLSVGNILLTSGSSYDSEISGTSVCSGYDQLRVTGIVSLNGANLNTSILSGFKSPVGQSYIIIDNDGSDAITGTFANLAEGATFAVNGYVFKISYVGGTGNDVVLTVQSVPAAPDTGLALLKANPLASLAVTGICGGAILGIARWQRRFATEQSR